MWLVESVVRLGRSPARVLDMRRTAYLALGGIRFHSLPDHHGERVLTDVAADWNAKGYVPSSFPTRCAGDYSPASRARMSGRVWAE